MKEREQIAIFDRIKKGELSRVAAAKTLGWSTKWVREKFNRYKAEGDQGLVHRNRNKPSSKRWDPQQKKLAISLFEGDFQGFGPTLAAEKLHELYGIKVCRETMRQAMIAGGHWHGKKQKIKHRKWRERKDYYGEMQQLDGSPHDWFEGRGPRCTLINFVDDATGRIPYMVLAPNESYDSVGTAFRAYIELNGIPKSLYVDYGCVFSVNTNNKEHDKITQFERMCNEVGTELIKAGSPQAKGRVERSHGTHQDRLVKELRLTGISTIEEANEYIKNVYLPKHNQKFAVKAKKEGDIHRPHSHLNLDKIFCLKEERKIQNDFTLSYKNRILQLRQQQDAVVRPKEVVAVHEKFDGILELYIRGIRLNYTELPRRPQKPKEVHTVKDRIPHKPAANHPWRTYRQREISSPANGGY